MRSDRLFTIVKINARIIALAILALLVIVCGGHDYFGNKNDLTNSTACRDGYVAGWKHWCKSDALDCAYWAATGTYPSLIAHAQKMGTPCIPWCLDRQSLAKGYQQNNSTRNMTTSQTNATTAGDLTEPAATTPYDSGYSHGCSDSKISNLSERYINQPISRTL